MEQLDIKQEEHQEVADNLFVPDINSADPEERKLARRIRIDKRIEALARQQKTPSVDAVAGAVTTGPDKTTLLQIQLEKSSEILKQLFNEAEEQVTNVRVANDSREVDRREYEKVGREKIYTQLHEDATLSMEMFEEIANKWTQILQYNDPLHIDDALQLQREKCNELLRQKDSIIALLKREVRDAEAKFYLDQQSQNEDIRMLAQRVEKQVTIMRAAHSIELQNIEDVMIQERANVMENNDKRWNEMYKRREEQELAISENKFIHRQDFEEVVTRVRIKHYEHIREVKISLERECDQLTQEFEYVKACAMTNSEKMDYNYQILRKREGENIIIKSNQKRLLNKLQDDINALRHKIRDYETQTNGQIARLYVEIVNLQKCIANEKAKSLSVSALNDKRYFDVWQLNADEATRLLSKILKIDQLLYEQQLGLVWEEPHIKLLHKEKLPSYKAAKKTLVSPEPKVSNKEKIGVGAAGGVAGAVAAQAQADVGIGYRRILHNVLQRVADKSGFLLESKIKKILQPKSESERVLVKVDNVFDALGVENVDDCNLMLQFFRPYIICPLCSEKASFGDTVDSPRESLARTTIESAGSMAVLSIGPAALEPLSDGATVAAADLVDQDAQVVGVGAAITPATTTPAIGSFNVATADLPQTPFVTDDENIEQIVAAIIDPSRLKDSSSDLALIKKKGECLGPTKINAEVEKKVTQVVDYATVIGDTASTTCLTSHPMYINPASVLRALREFVTNVMCKCEEKDIAGSDQDLSQTIQTVSRLLNPKEVKEYWERYKAILAARTSQLWEALSYGLGKYLAILEDRNKLNEELKCLHRQNRELKHLLEKFRNQSDQMKMKPPCAVERKSLDVMERKKFDDCK